MVLPSHQRDMSLGSTTPTTMSTLCELLGSNNFNEGSNEEEPSVSVQDERGDLRLHRALTEFSLQSVADPDNVTYLEQGITRLIRAWPDSVKIFNVEGLSPLHVACREGASLAVIHELIRIWPDSVTTATRNKRKMLPLHLVCRYYAGTTATKHKIILFLLRTYPAAAKITTGRGELALHLCCQNYFCTLVVLELLVKAYPAALKIGTHKKQQLAVHIACERQYMKRLGGKKIRNAKDDENNNNGSSSDEIIRYLVTAYTESVAVYDKKGELPLHTAVRGYQSTETVAFLLEVFPKSIAFLEDNGRTALHIAVSNAVPCMATIHLLLEADPSATAVVDDRGKLPSDYAAKNIDIVNTLIGDRPSTINTLQMKDEYD